MTASKTHAMSINLQTGGYNPEFFRLSTIMGIAGVLFGMIGILGVYDDLPKWMRAFFHFMQAKLLCDCIVFAADVWTLSGCEKYASLPEKEQIFNPALFQLSKHDMCHWGRAAYIIGFAVQIIFEVYMLFNVWKYVSSIELNPPYPIDFGYEQYDTKKRWGFYKVKEPEEIPMFQGISELASYDRSEEEYDAREAKKEYNPDGVKGVSTYAPDGFRGPAYIRAVR